MKKKTVGILGVLVLTVLMLCACGGNSQAVLDESDGDSSNVVEELDDTQAVEEETAESMSIEGMWVYSDIIYINGAGDTKLKHESDGMDNDYTDQNTSVIKIDEAGTGKFFSSEYDDDGFIWTESFTDVQDVVNRIKIEFDDEYGNMVEIGYMELRSDNKLYYGPFDPLDEEYSQAYMVYSRYDVSAGIDPFEDLNLVYHGEDDKIYYEAENLHPLVNYSFSETEGLSNGDHFTITAQGKDGLEITKTTKKYTVDWKPKYAKSLDEYTDESIDRIAEIGKEALTSNNKYTGQLDDGYEITPYKLYFLLIENASGVNRDANDAWLVYELNGTITTDTGETVPIENAYYVELLTDIMVSKGEVVVDSVKPSVQSFSEDGYKYVVHENGKKTKDYFSKAVDKDTLDEILNETRAFGYYLTSNEIEPGRMESVKF